MPTTKRRLTGVTAAALVAGAAVGFGSVTAGADPAPSSNSSSELAHYKELTTKTEKVQEAYLKAQYDLRQKQAQLKSANAKLAGARKSEKQAEQTLRAERARIDTLSAASLEGAQLSKLATLLGGQSPQELLQRKAALHWMAGSNQQMLTEMTRAHRQAQHAKRQAAAAQREAAQAKDAAAKLRDSLAERKHTLEGEIADVKQALAELSAPARKKLSDPGDQGPVSTPPGTPGSARTAVQAALAQRGDPYSWGSDGPNAFDCSGLIMFAYHKAGISLPHSSAAQFQHGAPVPRGQLKPGDLLFYGSSASSIHHVAMYVGHGKIVDAPTEGEPVQVESISGGGNDYYAAKRIVG